MGAPLYSSLAERSFTPSNKNIPVRTHFISAALPKHINTLSQIKVEPHNLDNWADNLPTRPARTVNCFAFDDNLFKIALESPLNKAPPFSL
jgi:hypothetical protein